MTRDIRSLYNTFEQQDNPKMTRCDNGSEIINTEILGWADKREIDLKDHVTVFYPKFVSVVA